MARKTAKDYKKEYDDICKQRDAFEARIIARAKELCKHHPDVVVATNITDVRTGDYVNSNISIVTAFSLIEIIEEHLASQHPHKQTEIDFSERECISERSPDGKHHYQVGKKFCYYCGMNKNYF